ncbi:MAG: hypothetical protein ACEQSA_04965 [Weeksellaceae bacterium]
MSAVEAGKHLIWRAVGRDKVPAAFGAGSPITDYFCRAKNLEGQAIPQSELLEQAVQGIDDIYGFEYQPPQETQVSESGNIFTAPTNE